MTVLVDTGVLVALINPKDALHQRAKAAMARILRREHGEPLGADVVLDEGLALLQKRHPVRISAESLAALFWGGKNKMPALRRISTDEDVLREATDLYFHHFSDQLSFTDCTLLVHARRLGADIATFDGNLKDLAGGLDL